jgi:hypothetical protein
MQQHIGYHQNLNQSDKEALGWPHAWNLFRQLALTTAHPQLLRNLKHHPSRNFIHSFQKVFLTDRPSELLHSQGLQSLRAHHESKAGELDQRVGVGIIKVVVQNPNDLVLKTRNCEALSEKPESS